jgi:hypothetical protein
VSIKQLGEGFVTHRFHLFPLVAVYAGPDIETCAAEFGNLGQYLSEGKRSVKG